MLVIVHNSVDRTTKQLVRVKLPTANYKAQLFDAEKKIFVDTTFDVFEQQHFDA